MTEQGAIWRQTAQKWTDVAEQITDDDWSKPTTCEDFSVPEGCSEALSGWNNKTREYEQIIIVGDRGTPEITCPEMPVFSTGPFNCTAVINPPAPQVEDECSAWTWEFELYGSVTDPKTGITVPNQLIATSVDQLVSGIEPGNYDLLFYLLFIVSR